MVWVKLCDRSFQRKRAQQAGLTAMAAWGAAMAWSAHELTDGLVDAEDFADAQPRSLRADIEVWEQLFLEALPEEATAAVREALEWAGATLRREQSRVVDALRGQLRACGLLNKRPGPNSGYALVHPDGSPWEQDQPLAAEVEERRCEARERMRELREERRRMKAQTELKIDDTQPVGTTRESEVFYGTVAGSDQDQERSLPAEGCVLEGEPLAEPEVDDLVAALAPLPGGIPRPPLVHTLRRAAEGLGVAHDVLLAVVRETAVEGALRAATGALRHVGGWLAAVVAKKLHSADGGSAAEMAHRQAMAAEGPKRNLAESRRRARARRREAESEGPERVLPPGEVAAMLRGWKPAT